MKAKFLLIAVCLFGLSGWAASLPPGFNVQKWNALVATAAAKGHPIETSDGLFMELAHIVPSDINKTHVADYFSDVGAYSDGKFYTGQVAVVSENWKLVGNTFDIDQWQFILEANGEIDVGRHYHLVEGTDSSIIKDDPIPATDKQISEALAARLSNWYKWTATPKVQLP